MTLLTHDFTRPPRLHPDHQSKLTLWLRQAGSFLAEVFTGLSLPTTIRFESCTTDWPIDSLKDWPDRTLAYQVTLAGCEAPSILAIPNPLAVVMISGLLGENMTEFPAERDLSAGEASVGEFLVATILGGLTEAWADETRGIRLQTADRELLLRRSKTFKPSEPIAICRLSMETVAGTAQCCWMLPLEFVQTLFGTTQRTRNAAPDASTRVQLESLVRGMNTEVAVRLGSVQLSTPQLANLRVGDLVVLDQRVSDPLQATIGNEPRYLGWPGQVGERQAYLIDSEVRSRQRSQEMARAG